MGGQINLGDIGGGGGGGGRFTTTVTVVAVLSCSLKLDSVVLEVRPLTVVELDDDIEEVDNREASLGFVVDGYGSWSHIE